MLFFYTLCNYIGQFLIMLIFMIAAILNATKKRAWIYYTIGGLFQLLSLAGGQKIATANGVDMSLDWIIYFCILFITIPLIVVRRNKQQEQD